MTDNLFLILLSIYFLLGWHNGFLKTIAGPIALFLATAFSFFYYAKTHNILIAALIGLIGPIILKLFFNFFIKLRSIAQEEDAKKPNILSRCCGATFSCLWILTITSIIMLLILIIPLNYPFLKNAQKDITQSVSYKFLDKISNGNLKKIPHKVETYTKKIQEPNALSGMDNSTNYKELLNDGKFQSILNDPETLNQIKDKNFTKLMTNPKIREMMESPDALKKLFAFQKELIEKMPDGNISPEDINPLTTNAIFETAPTNNEE